MNPKPCFGKKETELKIVPWGSQPLPASPPYLPVILLHSYVSGTFGINQQSNAIKL